MPEGPEIRRIADALAKQLTGRIIDDIRFGLAPLKHWQGKLIGAKITRVESYGKAMVMFLHTADACQLCIYSHNQLYGRWYLCDTDDYPDTKRQLRLAIECQGKSALLYSASEIEVFEKDALSQHAFIKKLGPDVLHESTTVLHVLEQLVSAKFKNCQLGRVLTDQSFVAGLGNYLRCEILFYSGLHAAKRSSDLSNKELRLLATAILKLARQSYQTGGICNDLKRAKKLMKQGEDFESARFHVFRRQGLPCYRCGTSIEKKLQAGQPCFYCPHCQRVG